MVSIHFPLFAWTVEMNKLNGICPIFALGDFDPTEGRQLVLPEINLLVEFSPGSLILIPSAALRRGNVPVRAHKKRVS